LLILCRKKQKKIDVSSEKLKKLRQLMLKLGQENILKKLQNYEEIFLLERGLKEIKY
jgi:hypothetical protein